MFDGESVVDVPPHAIAARGMARTFQNIRLFGAMTASENVMVAMHPHLRSGVASTILRQPKQRHEENEARAVAKELLEFVGIGGTDEEFAKNLPYGDQRRLEVARALALKPKLLLLDEPTAGMNPQESAAFTAFVHRVRDERGITILLDRARHEGGHGHRGANHRAGVRRQDRRGHARRDPCRPSRDRGVSRQVGNRRRSMTSDRLCSNRLAAPAADPMLSVDNIHVFYGNIAAVKGISLTVYPRRDRHPHRRQWRRQVHHACAPSPGSSSRSAARCIFEGQRSPACGVTRWRQRGISQSPEGRRIFPRMTVTRISSSGAFLRNDKAEI